MDEGQFRPTAKHVAFLAAGLFLSTILVPHRTQAADAPCPKAQPVVVGSASLRTLAASLRKREPIHILAIGSSSTQGVGASSSSLSYPAQLELYLERLWKSDDITVENAGVGGETVSETVRRLEAELKEGPDLVIWQLGTNDAIKGNDVRQFHALVARGLAAARAAGVDVILLDQQYYLGIGDLPRYERFVHAVREIGVQHDVPVFSRYALMKAWAESSVSDLRAMLAGDGFHMSDRGYTCLTGALGSTVARLVKPAVQRIPAAAMEQPQTGRSAEAAR